MLKEAKGQWDLCLAGKGQSPTCCGWRVRQRPGHAEPSLLGQIVWVVFCEQWEGTGRPWAGRRRAPTRGFRSLRQVWGEHAGGSKGRCLVVREASG